MTTAGNDPGHLQSRGAAAQPPTPLAPGCPGSAPPTLLCLLINSPLTPTPQAEPTETPLCPGTCRRASSPSHPPWDTAELRHEATGTGADGSLILTDPHPHLHHHTPPNMPLAPAPATNPQGTAPTTLSGSPPSTPFSVPRPKCRALPYLAPLTTSNVIINHVRPPNAPHRFPALPHSWGARVPPKASPICTRGGRGR